MDVFSNLNDFLNKDETPTFNTDSIANTPDSSFENEDLSETQENSPMDIIEIPKKASPKKRGRKRNALQVQADIDLTGELTSPTKSRRRIVDELKDAIIEAEIDLCNVNSPEPEETPLQTRSGRKIKAVKTKSLKAPKPKRISYQKALAVTNKAIPKLVSAQISSSSSSTSSVVVPAFSEPPPQSNHVASSSSSEDFAIDLTGEVSLKSYHTSAPLFDTRATRSESQKKRPLRTSEIEFDVDTITLHIKINGKMEKFKHKPKQRFFEILKEISDRHNVQVSNVLLFNEKDKRIQPEETPDSIGHKISSIYTCRVMDESKNKVKKESLIELKFQSDKWKKAIVLKVSRLDPLTTWLKVLCEKAEVDFKPDQISLEFDGDNIDTKDSPLELDFEGGEILDCRIKA